MRPHALAVVALAAACSQARPVATAPAPAVAHPLAATEPTPPQMIRRGQEGLTVERVDDARRHLEHAAAALDASIARSEARESESADYLFRVPPQRLDALMDSAATLGAVDERTTNAEDVTAQVVDVEGRIAALRASRDRLQELMNRATSVPNVIAVERELARVQGELESLEGRLNAMRGQVAMSELSVHLGQRHILGPLGLLFVGIGRGLEKLFVLR